MKSIALVRSAALRPVVALLERIGAPVRRYLARARLPPGALESPEALISLRRSARFMEEAARAEGIEHLGLLAAQETSHDALGVFGRLVRNAPTLHDAVETAVRLAPAFNSGGALWIVRDGDRLRIHHKFMARLDSGYQQADHYAVMLVLRLLQLAGGPDWRPAEVHLETGRDGTSGVIGLLAATKISFDRPASAVSFQRTLLSRPLAGASLLRLPDADLEAWVASAPASDLPGAILQVVRTLVRTGYPPISVTADALGMSMRSLQRRLAEAGLNYGRLIAQGRFASAVRQLEKSEARVVDIALDLGYSDHAHFTRAFHRWTGVSPREFRRRRLAPQESWASPAVALSRGMRR